MNLFNCLEISPRQLRYLVRIRGDRDRQLMISGVILAIICIALFINLTIMLTKPSSDQKQNSNKTEINETTSYIPDITSTNLPYIVTSVTEQIKKYKNYSFSEPLEYDSTGRSLDNYIYFNLAHFSQAIGYINSVSLRLFSEWKGNISLYLFILSSFNSYQITYRYAVTPQRNTTEWQTIKIPSFVLPVGIGNLLAVGTQENSISNNTNQIYVVKSVVGYCGRNIDKNMTIFSIEPNCSVALAYTMIYE